MTARRQEREFPACPRCTSQDIWRNGVNRANNQQWRCKTCGRVFVVEPYMPEWVQVIVDRMLIQQIAVPRIAEVMDGYVSRRWIYERRKCLS